MIPGNSECLWLVRAPGGQQQTKVWTKSLTLGVQGVHPHPVVISPVPDVQFGQTYSACGRTLTLPCDDERAIVGAKHKEKAHR